MTLLPPRLSEYEYQGDAIVKGQKVQQWRRVQTIGAKTNTYDFYVELTTQNPVQFHMMGYDIILGSHYDGKSQLPSCLYLPLIHWIIAFLLPSLFRICGGL